VLAGALNPVQDPDSDVRRSIDLRRLIRTVMDHRLAQPRNADSLRTTAESNAVSQSWPLIAATCAIAVAFVAILGSERPLRALSDKSTFRTDFRIGQKPGLLVKWRPLATLFTCDFAQDLDWRDGPPAASQPCSRRHYFCHLGSS